MKRKICILLAFTLIISLSIFVSGCDKKKANSDQSQVVNPISIAISISYPDNIKKPDLENFKFKAEEASSVLEATELYGSITEVKILVDTTNNQIEGINDVNNNSTIKDYYWKYSVNGNTVESNPQDLKLKDGDMVKWVYQKVESTDKAKEAENADKSDN